MRPLRPRWLALIWTAGLVGALLLSLLVPGGLLVLPWITLAALIVLAVAVLVLARRVRAHVRDPRGRRVDPLLAARTAVLAQTCAVFGALAAGWAAGLLVRELSLLRWRSATEDLPLIIADLVVGALVCAAGCVAEAWCKRPPDDTDEGTPHADPRRARRRDIPEGEGGYARDRQSPGPTRQ